MVRQKTHLFWEAMQKVVSARIPTPILWEAMLQLRETEAQREGRNSSRDRIRKKRADIGAFFWMMDGHVSWPGCVLHLHVGHANMEAGISPSPSAITMTERELIWDTDSSVLPSGVR